MFLSWNLLMLQQWVVVDLVEISSHMSCAYAPKTYLLLVLHLNLAWLSSLRIMLLWISWVSQLDIFSLCSVYFFQCPTLFHKWTSCCKMLWHSSFVMGLNNPIDIFCCFSLVSINTLTQNNAFKSLINLNPLATSNSQ